MKKIILISMLFAAVSFSLASCYFDAERNNPYDPRSGSEVIYMFATNNAYDGGMRYEGGFENVRDFADNACQTTRAAIYPSLPNDHVRAFLSINDTDEIRDMPNNYSVPTDRYIVGVNGIRIANNWADLLDGTLLNSLTTAGMPVGYWWSGSDIDGQISSSHCYNWESSTSGIHGKAGGDYTTDSYWISGYEPECNTTYKLLCIAWK